MHKEFRGVRGSLEGGGSAWEVSVEILMFMHFLGGPLLCKPLTSRFALHGLRKNQESHIHHRNLSSVATFSFLQSLFCKEKKRRPWSRAVYAFFFPALRFSAASECGTLGW